MSFLNWEMLISCNTPHDTAGGDRPRLGQLRTRWDSNGLPSVDIYAYNAVGSTLTVGNFYVIRLTGTEAQRIQVIAAATNTVLNNYVVAALTAVASTGYGWFTVYGKVTDANYTSGAAIADGDNLELLTSVGTLNENAAAWDGNHCGCALEADASDVGDMFLFGMPVAIAGS